MKRQTLIITTMALLLTSAVVWADASTMTYQGTLRELAGVPVDNGNYAMDFAIYEAASGGAALWNESHAAVMVHEGLFAVRLGATTPFDTLFTLHDTLWIEIAADTGAGLETYEPRIPLTGAPYAMHAQRAATAATAAAANHASNADALQGQPASAFAAAAHDHDGADITSGTVPVAHLPVGAGAEEVAPGDHTHDLNNLGDVNAPSPSDGQALTWDDNAWKAVGGYAIIRDVKPSGTVGGLGVTGWQTRALNDLDTNIPGVTLEANEFTLPPGRYRISASAPAYYCNNHKISLFNVTDDVFQIHGTSEYNYGGGNNYVQTRSMLEGRLHVSEPTTYRIRHYLTYGGGTAGNLGAAAPGGMGVDEVYTVVVIDKY